MANKHKIYIDRYDKQAYKGLGGNNMILKEWLKKENKTVADMSRDLNVIHSVVLRWTTTERIPTPENMQKIVEYTKGEVQPNDFYNVEVR